MKSIHNCEYSTNMLFNIIYAFIFRMQEKKNSTIKISAAFATLEVFQN